MLRSSHATPQNRAHGGRQLKRTRLLGRPAQRGFSLIELMIGMTISLLILAGIASAYLLSASATAETLTRVRLGQELRAILELMRQDVRRAGYWNAPATANPLDNPFRTLLTTALPGQPAGSCLLYDYDDGQGTFGFRLNGSNLQMRGGTTAEPADCASGGWEGINSGDVRILGLSFALETRAFDPAAPAQPCQIGRICQEGRILRVTLSGSLTQLPSVRQQLSSSIAIRNDRVFVQAAAPP